MNRDSPPEGRSSSSVLPARAKAAGRDRIRFVSGLDFNRANKIAGGAQRLPWFAFGSNIPKIHETSKCGKFVKRRAQKPK
jgi:hypothetical protein